MEKPLVSICIPNFNNGKYLEACIKSALAQTYPNIEIILVDDRSGDNSLKIANRYSDRIKVYSNEKNMGQPKNTNKCAELSGGKYLVILHSDDRLQPEFASKLAPLLERYPGAGMAAGERIISDEADKLTSIAPFYNTNCVVPGIRQAKVFLMTSFLPCQVLMRRATFDTVGGVHERHIVNLDGLLWFKFSLAGDLIYIQEPVSIYRIHGGQTTAQYNRTINHMMEYYGTLSEMFKCAEHIPYLKGFFPDAVKRTAELTVRYCQDIVRERDFGLAARFLALAAVFDPGIVENEQYRNIRKCLDAADPCKAYSALVDTAKPRDRGFSYAPPEGSKAVV